MSRRTPEQRERRNELERERRRTDPEWVEKVNARRRVDALPPQQPKEDGDQLHERYQKLATRRPPKRKPKPRTAAEMSAAVETSLTHGGWTWMHRSDVYQGRGRPGSPPLFATHPLNRRIVWIEVQTTKPGRSVQHKVAWREYLAREGCGVLIVHPANFFEVCAELDPSLAAFTAEDAD